MPNKKLQTDAVRGVDLCACSLRSHFRTQTTPHTPRLNLALMYKTNVRFLYKRRPLVILIDTFTSVRFGHKAEVQIQKKSYTTSHLEH